MSHHSALLPASRAAGVFRCLFAEDPEERIETLVPGTIIRRQNGNDKSQKL